MEHHDLLKGPVFFLIWCVFWIALSFGLASVSGWRDLARSYEAGGPATGKAYWMQSGQLGVAGYGGVLVIHTTSAGIRLATWPVVLFHAPLFIPWHDITVRSMHENWFGNAWVECSVAGKVIRLSEKVLQDHPNMSELQEHEPELRS